MLNIPEVIKELFLQDGIRKNFRVHFPNGERPDLVNKDIIEESVKFTESTCSQQTLRFGLTEASMIEFECVGVENIQGMAIECGIEVDVSSLSRDDRETYGTWTDDVPFPFYAVPYGVFVVDKCPRQADMKRRKVTAYTEYDVERVATLSGWHKKAALTFRPSIYRELLTARDADMEESSAQARNEYGLFNSADTYYILQNAIGVRQFTVPSRSAYGRTIPIDKAVILRCYFEPSIYDERAADLYKLIRNSAPSGNYYYYEGRQVYPNMNAAIASDTGLCRPVIKLFLDYAQYGDNRVAAYPIFFNSGDTVLINPADIIRQYGSYGTPIGYRVYVDIPTAWNDIRSAEWLTINVSTGDLTYAPIENWPIDTFYGRPGETKMFYKVIDVPSSEKLLTVESTLKTSFPGLGTYYGYQNALSVTDAANGVLELGGLFGNIQRDGSLSIRALSNANPYALTLRLIESLWYDEQMTPKIGLVFYQYTDGTDDNLQGELLIDDTALGAYDMTRNKILEMLTDRTQASVEAAISADFPGNVAAAFYTPIDLKMKGLPWLEDGDAITIELEDGTAVDSYILRHTISGVQHLVDDIEAQGEA